MYKYESKTNRNRERYFFKWFESEQVKVYTFNTYKDALIFALSEEIKQFTCIISDKVQTSSQNV